MGNAIGQVLAFGVGVALVPIPIVAVVLILGTPRARRNGPAFLAGWIAGLTIATLSALNPKNLLFVLAAATAIAQTGSLPYDRRALEGPAR